MNANFKVIKSNNETQIGVDINPFSSGALVAIEDNATTAWISLTPKQVEELIDNLKKTL